VTNVGILIHVRDGCDMCLCRPSKFLLSLYCAASHLLSLLHPYHTGYASFSPSTKVCITESIARRRDLFLNFQKQSFIRSRFLLNGVFGENIETDDYFISMSISC
jgi:hypothetical protein